MLLILSGFPQADTQEEAATAYDIAAIEHRGVNAVTNFDISRYIPNSDASTTNTPPETQPPTSSRRPRKRGSSSNTTPNSIDSPESTPTSIPIPGGGEDDEISPAQPEINMPRRRSFPDDIQTYFGCHESTDLFSDAIIFEGLTTSFSTTTPFCTFDFETYR